MVCTPTLVILPLLEVMDAPLGNVERRIMEYNMRRYDSSFFSLHCCSCCHPTSPFAFVHTQSYLYQAFEMLVRMIRARINYSSSRIGATLVRFLQLNCRLSCVQLTRSRLVVDSSIRAGVYANGDGEKGIAGMSETVVLVHS